MRLGTVTRMLFAALLALAALLSDGGHSAAEAFADATLALPLLRPGAFLAFDDYGYGPTKRGVDAFLAANGARVEALWVGTMLFARVS